jgi:hypothetical protein
MKQLLRNLVNITIGATLLISAGCATFQSYSYEQKQQNVALLSQVACSATLATIQDVDERVKLANNIYSVARAAYSLTGGSIPTPEQLSQAIASFGGDAAALDRYQGLIQSVSAIYAVEYNNLKDKSNGAKIAIDTLKSIAYGAEQAASVYVTK